MAIIKQTDWTPPVVATHGTVQQIGENPTRTYRELLMAEDVNGDPVPYRYDNGIAAGAIAYLRIPHAMSVGAGVGNVTPPVVVTPVATGVNDPSRIPDVVIPMLVTDMADVATNRPGVSVELVWDAAQALGLPVIDTGMWADENYIYIAIYNDNTAGTATTVVSFVVYVEYTHSVITNEIVTGTYYQMT